MQVNQVGMAVASGLALAALCAQAGDRVIAQFEGDTYGEWTVEGAAFGSGPAKGSLPGQM